MTDPILVIGGTGMLGEPVARQLAADGYAVRVLTRNPEKAKEKFGASFEIFEGDVEQPDSLDAALMGCHGVHINLNGGPTPESYDRIEHKGTAAVAFAAIKFGIERITYLSGTSVRQENRHFYGTNAKFQAEAAIKDCGVPYTIFRPSWFMESLPLFVRNGRATMIGKQSASVHWVAATDYARMVSKAYQTPEAADKTLYIYGPEVFTIPDAFKIYCAIVHPDLQVSSIPVWLVKLMATVTRNARLKDVANLMAYYEKFVEDRDPTEANQLLGAPTTTLQQWSEEQKGK